MAATSPVAAATSAGTCLRECERHTLQSTCAHSACLRVRAHLCTSPAVLRTVVNRPQTGPKLGPSAVGQRPALIHDRRSSWPHRVHLAISHGPERSLWTMEGE